MVKEKMNYTKYQKLLEEYRKKVDRIASYRMIAFLVMIFSFIGKFYYYPYILEGVFLSSLVLFMILVIIHDKYYKIFDYYDKYCIILNTYLERENGGWKTFLDKGEDFLNSENQFLSDLDILGDRSLFQYLSVCKTLGGRERLVQKLSNLELKKNTFKKEQGAILELESKISFDVDFQIWMMKYDQKKIHFMKNFSILNCKMENKKRDYIIALVASVLGIIFLLLGFFHVLSMRYFYGMFFFNFILSLLYSYIYREDFMKVTKMVQTYGGMDAIFQRILKEEFHSAKLLEIQRKMKEGQEVIVQLHCLDTMDSLKSNFLSNFLLNGFFCLNLVLLYRFSFFVNESFSNIKNSIADIEQLEAMISLANLGILRQNKCMPILSEKVGISFEEIQHPLLEESICVANDFASESGVHIITGSNMGGKTSFLRTIGINLILMNAGTYVCAKSFSASYFKLFTSMRVRDDIERGISTFYGELLRIKQAVDYIGSGNMMLLIDEIFKGTNYQDRIYGAKQVIQKLHTDQTVVFITTHDFELCEEKGVHNYHVQEYYENDQIKFDYKIKTGKCTSTNAKYLMKKLGIID